MNSVLKQMVQPSDLAHLDRDLFELLKLRIRVGRGLKVRVPTDSMAPLIKPGDLVEVLWPEGPVQVGDIAVFWRNGYLVCHQVNRVLAVIELQDHSAVSTSYIQTAGLNGYIDLPVQTDDVLGIARVSGF